MGKNLIYPTMVTPFKNDGSVDFKSLGGFIEKLIDDGADGLFSVCQSSEMFNLTKEEKVAIASFVKGNSDVAVVVSGDTCPYRNMDEKVEMMERMADTGADAVILISNTFAGADENDDVFMENLDVFLNRFNKNTPLGIYECPYPYKRLLSDRVVEFIRDTGRFLFFKDTCCDAKTINRRVALLKGEAPMLFNANAETLPCTWEDETRGYSGVHANISIKLVRAVMDGTRNDERMKNDEYRLLMDLNGYLSESLYPVSAKHILKSIGIFGTMNTRVVDDAGFTPEMSKRGDELYERIRNFEREYDKGNM